MVDGIESKLANAQWLGGQQPSKEDAEAFAALNGTYPNVDSHPHAFAWFALVSRFAPAVRDAWTAAAPAKADTAKGGKKGGKKEEPKKETPAAAEEDEFDPFADDDEDDQDARMALKAKAIGKKEKPLPIAKSIILLEVKVWEADTDLDKLGDMVKGIKMDGLEWKEQIRKEPVAFGVFKLIVGCVVEDLKVSVDDLTEKITDFEDLVQSVDILSFNKL